MKTILYYFTGTGNSLAIAEGLSRQLGDCDLVPVASTTETPTPISPAADRIGIGVASA
jgi:flavodoxin